MEKSISDIIREHVNEKLDQNFDYGNQKAKSDDLTEVLKKCNQQRDTKTTRTNIRSTFNNVVESCLRDRKIDPKSVLRKNSKAPKFNRELNATITPRPQTGIEDEKKPNQPIISQNQNTNQLQSQAQQLLNQNWTVESSGALWQGFFLSLRLGYPDLEPLTDEQEKSLGELWVRTFNRLFTDTKMEIALNLIETAGIILPKIGEARQKKKKREEKNKVPDTPKNERNTPPKETKDDDVTEATQEKFEEYGLMEGMPQITPIKQMTKKEVEEWHKKHAS